MRVVYLLTLERDSLHFAAGRTIFMQSLFLNILRDLFIRAEK